MKDPVSMGTIFTGYEGLTCGLESLMPPLVRRTWRERLFSWPWCPWEAYHRVEVEVTVSGIDHEPSPFWKNGPPE